MKTTKEFRKTLVIAAAVFICGVSLIGMIYIAYLQPEEYVSPGIVTSASPVAAPVQAIRPSALFRTNGTFQVVNNQSSSSYHSQIPSVSMPTMKGLWSTSSAQVHSVGGGGGGSSYGTTANAHSSSSRGIQYSGSVTMPLTTFVAMASTREVAPPAAQQAPAMAKMAVAPHRAPPPPHTGGDELPGEHQLTEQPIGAPWVLAFFALLYTISVYLSRRRRENGTK